MKKEKKYEKPSIKEVKPDKKADKNMAAGTTYTCTCSTGFTLDGDKAKKHC